MAALQKNGEEGWKKKVVKVSPRPKSVMPALDILKTNAGANDAPNSLLISSDKENNKTPEGVTLRKKSYAQNELNLLNSTTTGGRPVSITDRLSKLQSSQQTWQGRVGEKDNSKFTVAGKMERSLKTQSVILPADKGRMRLLPDISPEKPRSRSKTPTRTPKVKNEDLDKDSDRVKKTPKMKGVRGEKHSPVNTPIRQTSVPVIREERTVSIALDVEGDLDSFFTSTSVTRQVSDDLGADLDLDSIAPVETKRLSMPKRAAKRPGTTRRSRNPVKQLAARTDLKETYVETTTTSTLTVEDENGRKTSKVQAHLATEALAGLASTEDFSAVQLRKGGSKVDRSSDLKSHRELMLLQVKGRRCCQTRVVEPKVTSINSGDAYVLVTPREVFNWVGKYANVIERSRSAELAAAIFQKKDLGCKFARRVQTLEEEKLYGGSKSEQEFWALLGASSGDEPKAEDAGSSDEDEEFELHVNDLNMVWEVTLDNDVEELVPVERSWGCVPKHDLLDPAKVLVIDFGTECYVWNGSNASFDLRKAGANLVKKVWDAGFDHSGAEKPHPGLGGAMKGERPDWGVVGKINQNMETTLFKEKFLDWPDEAKVSRVNSIQVRVAKAIENTVSGEIDIRPFDADVMNDWEGTDPNMELEGSFLGRGRGYYDKAERRQYEIETISTSVNHVNEYSVNKLGDDWRAQFHSEDTYVIKWVYKVSLTGRDLKGNPSKHAAVGRERIACFFWQGADSKTTEKGASALMTVDIDREEGPQIKVEQGREHAVFLNLWQGRMAVHTGKRGAKRRSSWKLFILKGECSEEACLDEVPLKASSLRSIGSFVAVNSILGEIHVWHGASVPEHTRRIAEEVANRLKEEKPEEMGLKSCSGVRVTVHEEGSESSELRSELGLPSQAYVNRFVGPTKSPRLFHMSSIATGNFDVIETVCPRKRIDVLNTIPFSQGDLYDADQPGESRVDTLVRSFSH